MQHGFCRKPKLDPLPNAIFVDETRNWTELHDAAAAGNEKRLEFLLLGAVDRMPKETGRGNTPLHEAASRGYSRCVKLICTPPSPNKTHRKDREKSKAKDRVAHTIEALHNSILGMGNNEGLSALHLAVQNGHNQSCRELLLAGADPDIQNNYGDTPLHTACRYGHAGATRILLSASCDSNKTNLNGDTAVHITSAMGRRKLTRILLEADTLLNIKNAQGETPHDIATRKNYSEIIEILNNPRRIRNRSSKHKEVSETRNDGGLNTKLNPNQQSGCTTLGWSPYGCHYFPDPRAFPSPKLETLPKEPLSPGEQYFLDLAGNIHKGPVSVGNTCYCGSFFRHMENKLNCNRRSLKKYVYKTKERLGHKVQALALRTNDQIEQLTRTMIADRIRCENKRIYLNEYLRRGERLRSTLENYNRTVPVERTVSRCRSLELLDKLNGQRESENRKLTNSKSFDMLKEGAVEVTIHNTEEHLASYDEDDDDDDEVGIQSEENIDEYSSSNKIKKQHESKNYKLKKQDDSKLDELKLDFVKISERLGNLLEKTTLIMEKDKEGQQAQKVEALSPPLLYTNDSFESPSFDNNQKFSLHHERTSSIISPTHSGQYSEYRHIHQRYPNSSDASNPSQHSNSWECEASPTGSNPHQDLYKYCLGVEHNEHMIHNVIRALRKDNVHFPRSSEEVAAVNVQFERATADKVRYKDLKPLQHDKDFLTTDYIKSRSAIYASCTNTPNSLTTENTQNSAVHNEYRGILSPLSISVRGNANGTCLRDISLDPTLSYDMENNGNHLDLQQNPIGHNMNRTVSVTGHREIRNCEIKNLKKSSNSGGQVKELVAHLQHKINETTHREQPKVELTSTESHLLSNNIGSISSDAVLEAHNQHSTQNIINQNTAEVVNHDHSINTQISYGYAPTSLLSHDRCHIPKDAYFHELPNKPRIFMANSQLQTIEGNKFSSKPYHTQVHDVSPMDATSTHPQYASASCNSYLFQQNHSRLNPNISTEAEPNERNVQWPIWHGYTTPLSEHSRSNTSDTDVYAINNISSLV